MTAQAVPYESVLNAPATAVLALIAVVVVVALVFVLRALLLRKSSDASPSCKAEHGRIWQEIDILRRRSHDQADQLHEYHLEVVKVKRRMGDAEE